MTARFFDLAICNTQEGVDYLRNLVGISASKLWHYKLEVADRDALSGQGSAQNVLGAVDRPVFLFVGRLIRGKGIHEFLEACSLLVERRLDRFSVVLVGDGFHKDEFRGFARLLGIEKRIRWEGFVRYENMGNYYRACDIFVLPSLEDTWGVVVPEAMVFEKPILCSRYAGAKEIVRHGVNGFVFDAHRPEELADYMARFICEPDLIRKFGSASKDIIAQYSPERTAKVLAGAVMTLLDPDGGAATAAPIQKSFPGINAEEDSRKLLPPSNGWQTYS